MGLDCEPITAMNETHSIECPSIVHRMPIDINELFAQIVCGHFVWPEVIILL